MFLLAQRNLFHDKIRLAATLAGVSFAVVLIVVELGLYFGFTGAVSSLIDNSRADLWVTSEGVNYLELGTPFRRAKLYQVMSVPGVVYVQEFIHGNELWTRPDSRQSIIQVVGFNPDSGMGGPWRLAEGSVRDLKIPDGVIIDRIYQGKLGVASIGDVVEIAGHRARVVAFSEGIRSFTTEPFVFTSAENAHDFGSIADDRVQFLLVKIAPGVDVKTVRQNIAEHVRGVSVYTTSEFGRMTRHYWTFTTGAGIAILLAAVLGLVVGFVVVAQTIYATTVDHIKEFGTLKAMGAPNSCVYKVILIQAGIAAILGYAMGLLASLVVVRYAQPAGAPILINGEIVFSTFVITVLMCVGAGLVSINKVTRLDPAIVFKG